MAGLMAAALIIALDCAVARSPLSGRPLTVILLLLGGLPMGNVLVVGLLPLIRNLHARREQNPWLVGFEVAGWAGLLLFASIAVYHPDPLRETIVQSLGSTRALGNHAFLATICSALLLPQLALALLGGWLNSRRAEGRSV
jgi:hypothetical protein